MTCVIVNDASCLIDLRKGGLLPMLPRLPYELVVPLPIRHGELIDFTADDWAALDAGGLQTFDLSGEQVQQVMRLKEQNARLSVNDCFCLVTSQCHAESILLTGDQLLRQTAATCGVRVHGVLWVVEELHRGNLCDAPSLHNALNTWKADPTVFLPDRLIEAMMRQIS